MDELFKVLGDNTRLRILHLLIHQELCVCEIEEILETTQSNVSRHLGRLRQVGIITYEKRAQWAYYKVHPNFITSHSLLFQYLKEKQEGVGIYREDLKKLTLFNENHDGCKTLAR